ncbi:MAG: M20/M25/M40 family metallo-hydrolase [Planctomycetota bacterium]
MQTTGPKLLLIALLLSCFGCAFPSYKPSELGDFPPQPDGFEAELQRHVEMLAGNIGSRNAFVPDAYERAATYIEQQFREAGLEVRRQPVTIPDRGRFKCGPMTVYNIEAVVPGSDPNKTVVVGAHYDTKVASRHWKDSGTSPRPDEPGTPGADDNASGVAVILALAKQLANTKPNCTIRFVAFANEEPPFFQTEAMGSLVYAKSLKEEGVDVRAMVCMEMLGSYSETSQEQFHFVTLVRPILGLPSLNNEYVVMLGNMRSYPLMRRSARVFQKNSTTRLRVLPMVQLPYIVAWSDDWSFWNQGFTAFSLTDTGLLRNHNYHELSDTPDTLDYDIMADVAWGAVALVKAMADEAMD